MFTCYHQCFFSLSLINLSFKLLDHLDHFLITWRVCSVFSLFWLILLSYFISLLTELHFQSHFRLYHLYLSISVFQSLFLCFSISLTSLFLWLYLFWSPVFISNSATCSFWQPASHKRILHFFTSSRLLWNSQCFIAITRCIDYPIVFSKLSVINRFDKSLPKLFALG